MRVQSRGFGVALQFEIEVDFEQVKVQMVLTLLSCDISPSVPLRLKTKGLVSRRMVSI